MFEGELTLRWGSRTTTFNSTEPIEDASSVSTSAVFWRRVVSPTLRLATLCLGRIYLFCLVLVVNVFCMISHLWIKVINAFTGRIYVLSVALMHFYLLQFGGVVVVCRFISVCLCLLHIYYIFSVCLCLLNSLSVSLRHPQSAAVRTASQSAEVQPRE